MRRKSLTAFFLLLVGLSFPASGQLQINSPFARFNIGNLVSSASYKSLGMGGVGIAMTGNNSVFFSNPASYSAIDTNSFTFDIGIDYGIIKLKEGQNQFKSEDMNFNHLIMGFPLAKGIGVAVGIVPMSNGYYKLAQTVTEDDPGYDPLVGQYTSQHNGSGGYNNLFLGAGMRITRNLSAGVNMKLLFGQLTRTYLLTFSDYSNVYNNSSSEKLEMHGINFDYGLHYVAELQHDYFVRAGVSYSASKYYRTNHQLLAYRYSTYNTRDTISYVANDTSKSYIPGTLGLGIAFGKKNKFTAGFDYVMTRWSKSAIQGSTGYAEDTKSFRFGLEYIPDKYSNYGIFRRFEYRAGAHFGSNYLIINGKQAKEYGFSCGLGIPIGHTPSRASFYSRTNFYFDYTKLSLPGPGSEQTEHYFTIGASLNFYDVWFLKRRYD